VRLHDFAVAVVPHPAERDDEQKEEVEGHVGHAAARAKCARNLLLHRHHLVLRVLLQLGNGRTVQAKGER